MSRVALVMALIPPPNGKMSYATVGADVTMWNACPSDVPWGAASSLVTAGVTPAGQSGVYGWPAWNAFRNRIATCPGMSCPPVSGAYVSDGPVPEEMRAKP